MPISLALAGCAFDSGGAPGADPGIAPDDGSGGGGPGGEDPGPGGGGPGDPDPVAFQSCTALPYVPGEPTGFDFYENELVALSGGPTHHAQDVVTSPDAAPSVTATFIYGYLAIDIVDEAVRASVDTCDGWLDLGEARTDVDGRVTFALDDKLPVGVYHVVFEVLADGTTASAYIWSLPAGTRLAVFDIDGTLTTSNTELFADILLGDYQPALYPDATTLTLAHEARGHLPVYLAARPGFLTATTRAWLDEQGFAHGIVRYATRAGDLLPTDGGVGAFKRDALVELAEAGAAVDVAYGDAGTDIFAYLSAGLAPDQVWIIGDHGGEEGTHAVSGGWSERAEQVAAEAQIEQPFSR
ncbi:MAG TPA: hypothetical protein VKZ63_01260 [Kofleriaceae bacterium]|nr:hypothetical protein [Kofleriaceae bacterium]